MKLHYFVFILLGLALAACGGARAQENLYPTPTNGPILTFTPYGGIPKTATPTPLPSQTPTAVLSPTPTAAPTVTPDPALAQAKMLGYSWLPHYIVLVSVDFPAALSSADQYAVTLDDKPCTCQILAQYPNRLYCQGPENNTTHYAMLRIFQKGAQAPGYEKKFLIDWFDDLSIH